MGRWVTQIHHRSYAVGRVDTDSKYYVMRLEDLTAGMWVTGIVAGGPVHLIAVAPMVGGTCEVVYRTTAGPPADQILMRAHEPGLAIYDEPRTPFDADAEEFKLAAEAVRIQCAALIDPKFAVTS